MKTTVCHMTVGHGAFDVRIFHKECVALAEAGYDVRLVVPHERDEVIRGVRIHALPVARSRAAKLLLAPWVAYRKVLSIRPRPAICHFHEPCLLPVGMALRLRGFRVIFDVHENMSEQLLTKHYIPRPLRRVTAMTYRFMEKLLTSGMASVHVLDSISRLYRPPRVTVRNLPVVFAVPKGSSGIDGTVRLVYAGGLSRLRGALTMLEAARLLNERGLDFHLEIMGTCHEPGLDEEMARFIADAGMQSKVDLLGTLPFQEAQDRVARADIGLCLLHPTPNYLNSLATKILEYMSYGLPVVASDFPCWREYVTDTGAGFQVNPLNPAEAADKLEWLIANPKEAGEMGARGRQAVLTTYNWKVEEKKLLEFYRRILRTRALADKQMEPPPWVAPGEHA